jgi:hypothetical protein
VNWVYRIALWLQESNLIRFLPWRFLKAYVYAITVRGRKNPYEAEPFFESYYRMVSSEEFSDRITILPTANPLHSKYEYNSVENSIIRGLLHWQVTKKPAVLDVDSGAGHWIDFYLNTFGAIDVCVLELSKTCADQFRKKYVHTDSVSIIEGDNTDKSSCLDHKFDIVNAIGVVKGVCFINYELL